MDLSELFKQVLLLSIMGSILALGIFLIKVLFRQKLSAKLHYCIWFFLILRLIIPLNIQSHISLYNFIPTEDKKLAMPFIIQSSTSFGANSKDTTKVDNIADKNKSVKSSTDDGIGFNLRTASLIWIIGVVVAVLYILYINITYSTKLRKKRKCDRLECIKLLEQIKESLKIKEKIDIVYYPGIKSPGVFGIIRPKILISEDILDNMTVDDIKFIFLHEATHIKRKDLLANIIFMLIQIIYWFNPFIWYSIHRMKLDCEIACDATVLKMLNSEEIKAYGQTIINMLKVHSKSPLVSGTLGFASKYSKRRIIMISRFKKHSAIYAVLALFLTMMVGCSSIAKTPGNAINTPGSSNNSSSSSNISTPSSSNNSSKDNNTAGTTNDNKGGNSSNTQNDSQNQLLASMMKLAQQGKVINSEFPVKTTVIDTVEKKLGKADKVDWVPAAKGTYATFSKYNLVFGFNKGDQIFEARSYDSKLKKITLSMVKRAYGTPAYSTMYNGQQIIGYVAGKEYKILLVFNSTTKGSNDLILDHYSVLYPAGTVNMMADDPGRDW